jgi:uncharacterized protein (TIGR00369 family)
MERKAAHWNEESNGRREATRTGRARDPDAHQGQFRAPGLDAASRRTPWTCGARPRPHRVAQSARSNQQHGYIHAGATSAIADSAGGYAAFTLFPENTAVLTVEYKINLLAPAVGDHIEAVGTVLKSGRTLTVCQLEVFAFQGPKRSLVAAGQQTLICVPEGSEQ